MTQALLVRRGLKNPPGLQPNELAFPICGRCATWIQSGFDAFIDGCINCPGQPPHVHDAPPVYVRVGYEVAPFYPCAICRDYCTQEGALVLEKWEEDHPRSDIIKVMAYRYYIPRSEKGGADEA